MANILLAWELGAGFGHVANLLPIAQQLIARGHTLHVALRDLSVAQHCFRDLPIKLWQAPFKNSRPKVGVTDPRTFADILFNCGFGDASELLSLVSAWRQLFDAVQPAVMLAEHSPSALLAAHIQQVPTVMLGAAFCCPTATTPFPDLRPWLAKPIDPGHRAEEQALAHCNQVRAAYGAAPWQQLSELFRHVRQTCLLTIPELDPYGPRPAEDYFGVWPQWGGKAPAWPTVPGKRIFAYLKPFPAAPQLLALLAELRTPTIMVCDGIDARLQQRYARPWLRFENEPLDMRITAAECHVGICNANHGTTYALLQAGKPALYLPLHLEQTLTAHALVQRKLGVAAAIRRPEQICLRLVELLRNERLASNCQHFAQQLQQRDAAHELQRVVSRIETCLHG